MITYRKIILVTLLFVVGSAACGLSRTVCAQDVARDATLLPPPPTVVTILGGNLAELRHLSASQAKVERDKLSSRLKALEIELIQSESHVSTIAGQPEGEPEAVPPPANTSSARAPSVIAKDIEAAQVAESVFDEETICGVTDRSQNVELYDGTLGPTKAFVTAKQGATGQIQWNDNLQPSPGHSSDVMGTVHGVRWCTGTLIANNMFLTAGHCLKPQNGGWVTPEHMIGGKLVAFSPPELAPLLHINFNYEIDPSTGKARQPDVYPVVKLLEYYGPMGHPGTVDYAILQLGAGPDGMPSSKYKPLPVDYSKNTLTKATELTMIQHPNGDPKRVAAGGKIRLGPGLREIFYADLDTLGGSSGSGIIDQNGNLIGVHTDGGCTVNGGSNHGYTLVAITQSSHLLH